MLTDKDKKQILSAFKETVEGIANKEYQKRVWIRGEGPEVDDFDETICYFSQEGDGIIDKYKEFGLTEYQCEALKNFREQFKVFYDEHDFPQEFIESLEWARIIEMAKQLLKVFK